MAAIRFRRVLVRVIMVSPRGSSSGEMFVVAIYHFRIAYAQARYQCFGGDLVVERCVCAFYVLKLLIRANRCARVVVFIRVRFMYSMGVRDVMINGLLLFLRVVFYYVPSIVASLGVYVLDFSNVRVVVVRILIGYVLRCYLGAFRQFRGEFRRGAQVVVQLFPFVYWRCLITQYIREWVLEGYEAGVQERVAFQLVEGLVATGRASRAKVELQLVNAYVARDRLLNGPFNCVDEGVKVSIRTLVDIFVNSRRAIHQCVSHQRAVARFVHAAKCEGVIIRLRTNLRGVLVKIVLIRVVRDSVHVYRGAIACDFSE